LRRVLEQRRASEFLRRAKVAALDRAPSGRELPLQVFRICHRPKKAVPRASPEVSHLKAFPDAQYCVPPPDTV